MNGELVDSVARQRIEDHGEVCTHRHGQLIEGFAQMWGELRAIRNGSTRFLVAAFFGSLTVIGGLVAYIWAAKIIVQ